MYRACQKIANDFVVSAWIRITPAVWGVKWYTDENRAMISWAGVQECHQKLLTKYRTVFFAFWRHFMFFLTLFWKTRHCYKSFYHFFVKREIFTQNNWNLSVPKSHKIDYKCEKVGKFCFQLDTVSKLMSSLLHGVFSCWKGLNHLSKYKQNHSGINGKYIL